MSDNNRRKVSAQVYTKYLENLRKQADNNLITPEVYEDTYNEVIRQMVNNGLMDDNAFISNAQESNDTKKVNETGRHNLVTEDIQRQNANTNTGRLTETINHNRNAEDLGQKNYDLDVAKWNAEQKAKRQKELDEAITNGTKVKMRAPNNKIIVVDSYDVKEALKQGCKRVH